MGTFGVFFGMLVVYKTGAIRVTPKFTRWVVGAMFGALALMLGNLVIGFFNHGSGLGLRTGGPLSILFSLVVIGIAAFSFLIDFDAADQMIRAGAPEKAAWGIALGLTVTLVWLYLEILRLLSYLQKRLASSTEKAGTPMGVPAFLCPEGVECALVAEPYGVSTPRAHRQRRGCTRNETGGLAEPLDHHRHALAPLRHTWSPSRMSCRRSAGC